MAASNQPPRRERGASSLEFVGITATVLLLLAVTGAGLGARGTELGDTVGKHVRQAVSASSEEQAPRHAAAAAMPSPLSGRRRAWHERRRQGGPAPVRVPRDELRLSPVVEPSAAWQRGWTREVAIAGIGAVAEARACALCTALEWSREVRSGAGVDGDGGDLGLDVEAAGEARLALASAELGVRAGRSLGAADVSAQGRLRGMLGAQANGTARARIGRSVQDVELDGGAMAGAAARAEGRVGVDLLGIAIRQAGQVEAWAGAGARGGVGVRRDGARVDWRFGWGVALGVGGAAEWRGTIDASKAHSVHGRRARDALDAAVRAARFDPRYLRLRATSFQ